MKYNLLVLFAVIGVFSSIYFIVKFVNGYNRNNQNIQYDLNCEKVKIGMTLEEARRIIEDSNYDNRIKVISGIKIGNYKDTILYTLNYSSKFAASENTHLEFNPNTLIVTKVTCGE